MRIEIFLSVGSPETTVVVSGDVITVDGVAFDLSSVPEGGEAEANGDHPFCGPIRRVDGEIQCCIRWAYDPKVSANDQSPTMPVRTVTQGAIASPVLRKGASA